MFKFNVIFFSTPLWYCTNVIESRLSMNDVTHIFISSVSFMDDPEKNPATLLCIYWQVELLNWPVYLI